MPERAAGAGEGADRDQALKRAAAAFPGEHDQCRTARRDDDVGSLAGGGGVRREAEKNEAVLIFVSFPRMIPSDERPLGP